MQVITTYPELKLPPRPTVIEPTDEMREAVNRDLAAYNQEARKRTLDDRTLYYHLRGLDGIYLAYRSHSQGVEILGVGLEEVMQVRRTYGDGPGCGITYRDL